MKKLTFNILLTSILFMNNVVFSQSLKKVGGGFYYKIIKATNDNDGNIYTASFNIAEDSLLFHKYNLSSNSWSEITRVKNHIDGSSLVEILVFFVLKGEIYCSNIKPDFLPELNTEIMKFTNNNWTTALTVNYRIHCDNLYYLDNNNKIILTSNWLPITLANNINVYNNFIFDGTNVENLNLDYQIITFKDTILNYYFPSLNSKQINFVNNNSLENYLNTGFININLLVISDSTKYIINYDSIYTFNKDIVLKSQEFQLSTYYRNKFYTKENDILHIKYKWNDSKFSVTKITSNLDVKLVMKMFKFDSLNRVITIKNKSYFYSIGNHIYSDLQDLGTFVEFNNDTFLNTDTIIIKTYQDFNNNLTYDNGETQKNIRLYINDAIFQSNENGEVKYYETDDEDIEVKALEGSYKCYLPKFTGVLKPKTINNSITIDTLFFPIEKLLNGNMGVRISAWSQARINENINTNIFVYHHSCDFSNKNIKLELKLEPNTLLVNSTPNYTSKNGDVYTYTITDLNNYNQKYINLTLKYPIDKFKMNDKPLHTVRIYDFSNDDNASDNVDSLRITIKNSYDPNIKTSMPEGKITSDLKKIRYTIHFQNEGNDLAYRVVVEDSLWLNMPVYAFQMVYATHPYKTILYPHNNLVKWEFDNINLTPKSQNEELSKGYLVFDAYVRGDLKVGDSIRNNAYIYFDYNQPIITNYAVIKRVDEKYSIEVKEIANVKIYPNPCTLFLNIDNLKEQEFEIFIYSSDGKMIEKIFVNKGLQQIDLTNYSKGIYFINGINNGKIFKTAFVVE